MKERKILSAIYEQIENELPPTLEYKKMQIRLFVEVINKN